MNITPESAADYLRRRMLMLRRKWIRIAPWRSLGPVGRAAGVFATVMLIGCNGDTHVKAENGIAILNRSPYDVGYNISHEAHGVLLQFHVQGGDTIHVEEEVILSEGESYYYAGGMSDPEAHYRVLGPVIVDTSIGDPGGRIRKIVIEEDGETVRAILSK